jgi:hypothetical protein
VPVPRAASFTALNEQLLEGCRGRLGVRLRGHEETIGERIVRDLAVFHALPKLRCARCNCRSGFRISIIDGRMRTPETRDQQVERVVVEGTE